MIGIRNAHRAPAFAGATRARVPGERRPSLVGAEGADWADGTLPATAGAIVFSIFPESEMTTHE